MKTLFTVLTVSIFTFNVHSQKNLTSEKIETIPCSLPKRQVLGQAVEIWKASYHILRTYGLIDKETKYDRVKILKIHLDELRDKAGNKDSAGEVIFRYYMEAGLSVPRIAIRDAKDSTIYLTINEYGNKEFQTLNELQSKFKNWEGYLDRYKDHLVMVKEYRYCWESLNIPMHGELVITNVAHTVSPDNARYELPQDEYEGYIAFDMIFNYKYDSFIDTLLPLELHDFAVPCPKNCPEFK